MSSKDSKLIMLSAGGTGGHMMPAQSLGIDLLSRGYRVEIITDHRGMKYAQMFKGMKIHVVKAGTLGTGFIGKTKGVCNLALGIMQAMVLIKSKQPCVVVGFGGYPSFPGVYAAQCQKIKTIIHEQNAVLGRANVFLSSKAERIALSLPLVGGLEEANKVRTVMTGNPVRPEIAELFSKPYPNLKDNGELRILIMGGSLGASVFSRVIPDALAKLSSEYRSRLRIVQQCREEDLLATRNSYDKSGIKADISTFIDDVATELDKAHLIIARSGASTVAEIATAGRPAIFVPYPYHKDQQQKMNADAFADAGGGWVMMESGFTVEALLVKIELFLQNPELLFKAAEKARQCGKPDATRKLGNLVTAIASDWNDWD